MAAVFGATLCFLICLCCRCIIQLRKQRKHAKIIDAEPACNNSTNAVDEELGEETGQKDKEILESERQHLTADQITQRDEEPQEEFKVVEV